MSEQAVAALEAERDEVLAVARTLSAAQWAAPSDCTGWRVQDVIAHMANACRTVVDPSTLAPGVPGDLEATQAAQVDALREWAPERVLADYEDITAKAIEALRGMQAPGVAETVIQIENAGRYPLHLLANALVFDHYCHLRNDILRPNGPIDQPIPASDDARLSATIEYLLAGLPQMSAGPLNDAVVKPLALRLSGPGGGDWTILPANDGDQIRVVDGADSSAAATVTSTVPEFTCGPPSEGHGENEKSSYKATTTTPQLCSTQFTSSEGQASAAPTAQNARSRITRRRRPLPANIGASACEHATGWAICLAS